MCISSPSLYISMPINAPLKMSSIVCVCVFLITSYHMESDLKGIGLESSLKELVVQDCVNK